MCGGAVELLSPNGQVRITAGDAEVPIFIEPFSYLGITYGEGTWYPAGYGTFYYVRRYVPGTAYAREYVQTKAARGCSDISVISHGTRDREDALRAINALVTQWGSVGIQAQVTAGEVAFTCRTNEQLRHGYYFAASGRKQEAQTALERLLDSYRVNPQWARMQSNSIAQPSEIIARAHQEVSRLINDTYWTKVASDARISRIGADARRGVEEVVDLLTGRQMTVGNGSSYYWVDQRGMIVGTQTSTIPYVDFRPLVRLP